VRVREWYEALERDSVVASHGGVCRALMAHLQIETPQAASMGDIRQGAVYVFDGNGMTCHD
jgi:broad specificity phosphatase PhoE